MKIYHINECDWYAAETLESAIEKYMEDSYCGKDDVDAEECTESDLDKLVFIEEDLDSNGDTIEKTFREKLAEMMTDGEQFPCAFASTEY